MSLTVLIPFYNEEEFLQKSVERVLEKSFVDKIILLNDGSTDNSKYIADNLESLFSDKLNAKHFNTNKGKGSALNKSRHYINTTHVIIHDADLEYHPDDMFNMFELSKKYPNSLILGSRFIGKKNRNNIYMRTIIANKFFSKLFSIVYKKKVTDLATCYKLFPSEYFKNTLIKEKGFTVEIEMLANFIKQKGDIIETPITYSGRSYSEGKKIKSIDGIKYIISIFKYRLSK